VIDNVQNFSPKLLKDQFSIFHNVLRAVTLPEGKEEKFCAFVSQLILLANGTDNAVSALIKDSQPELEAKVLSGKALSTLKESVGKIIIQNAIIIITQIVVITR